MSAESMNQTYIIMHACHIAECMAKGDYKEATERLAQLRVALGRMETNVFQRALLKRMDDFVQQGAGRPYSDSEHNATPSSEGLKNQSGNDLLSRILPRRPTPQAMPAKRSNVIDFPGSP